MAMMLAVPTLSFGTQTKYPLEIINCGVKQTFTKPPERAVVSQRTALPFPTPNALLPCDPHHRHPRRRQTMNQGMTEFLLAMGLEDSMAGTAYIDDEIWPRYEKAYKKVTVLAEKYATDAQLMEVDADFITANYGSAFSEKPRRRSGSDSGVFTNKTVGPCDGEGSDYFAIYGTTNATNMAGPYGTCRPQLHEANIGTWLETTYCEDKGLRPEVATEQTVYDAIKEIGAIFNVNDVAKMLIDQIEADFDAAQTAVKNTGHALTAILLDGIGCGDDGKGYFVGAGEGSVNMILESAGMTNLFGVKDSESFKEDNYACVTADEIIALSPDVLLLIEADWDKALNKINHLHNSSAWCAAPFVQRADYIKIPFSASALSPRNGAAPPSTSSLFRPTFSPAPRRSTSSRASPPSTPRCWSTRRRSCSARSP